MELSQKNLLEVIERYYRGCNTKDRELIASCLTNDAIHYFPGRAPARGSASIADLWVELAETQGSQWTIDHFLGFGSEAVIEWSHYRTKIGHVLRGAEWFEFDSAGKIREIRAYYAAPRDSNTKTIELCGFPYKERGYLEHVPQRPQD